MVRSMTGYGKGTAELDGDCVSVELSAVNHRFLDCSARLPFAWAGLEPVVKETVRKRVSRGKVSVTVTRKHGNSGRRQSICFDRDIAQQYIDASRKLVQQLGSMETLRLDVLARLDGVFYQEEPEEDLDKAAVVVVEALEQALERLDAMRATEGKALREELVHRVGCMREALALIEQRLPELNAVYEQRLRARIEELQGETALTEERLAMEIALMAEKGDVTEEVVRLKTHLDHALNLLGRDEPVGRELNFLAQELHREVSTLGAKVRDGDVIKEVLRAKSELERFREQVQNVE